MSDKKFTFENVLGTVFQSAGIGFTKAAERRANTRDEVWFTALANLATGVGGMLLTETDKKNAQTETKPQTENKPQTETKPQTENKPQTETKPQTEAKPQATTTAKPQVATASGTNVINNNNIVSNIINNYFGAYNGNSNSNVKISAVIVINNYFDNSASNNSVAVIVDNIANFQDAQKYIDAIMSVQNTQQKEEPAKQETPQKEEAVQDSKVASADTKAMIASSGMVLPTTIIIISFERGTAEVLSNDKEQSKELIAEAANIKEVEKIQDKNNTYEIVKGDTLWQIAKDNNVSLSELREANPWTEDRFSPDGKYALIHPGETLVIPGSLEAAITSELNITSKELANGSKEINANIKADEQKDANQDLNRATQK